MRIGYGLSQVNTGPQKKLRKFITRGTLTVHGNDEIVVLRADATAIMWLNCSMPYEL